MDLEGELEQTIEHEGDNYTNRDRWIRYSN